MEPRRDACRAVHPCQGCRARRGRLGEWLPPGIQCWRCSGHDYPPPPPAPSRRTYAWPRGLMAGSLSAQIAAVQTEFETRPEGLIRHVQRVLVEALDLAARYDLDKQRVELATWGHDLLRAFPPAEQLKLAIQAGLPLALADRADPVLLYGPLAAGALCEQFGVTDDEVLAAVRDHTLGHVAMPMLAKVILLADKFERRKRDRATEMKE